MAKRFGNFLEIICAQPNNLQIIRNYCKTITSKNSKTTSFLILKATLNDYASILNLLSKAYYPDEKIYKSINLGKEQNTVLNDEMMQILTQGLSLCGRCKNSGDLAGVCLSGVSYSWDSTHSVKIYNNIGCKKTKQFLQFLSYLQDAPKLFDKYRTTKILEIRSIAVHPTYRRKGLAHALLEEALQRGYEKFDCIRINSTDLTISRICETLGMSKVLEVPKEKINELIQSKTEIPELHVFVGSKKTIT